MSFGIGVTLFTLGLVKEPDYQTEEPRQRQDQADCPCNLPVVKHASDGLLRFSFQLATSFPDTAVAIVRMFATASAELARIKASRRL
ncbi:MAG TPA: hypothetical protein VJW23_03660 [Propionibacteriaceae bacterium]|nr:hypothetical protein [Propionibacteriaceae bacterium]